MSRLFGLRPGSVVAGVIVALAGIGLEFVLETAALAVGGEAGRQLVLMAVAYTGTCVALLFVLRELGLRTQMPAGRVNRRNSRAAARRRELRGRMVWLQRRDGLIGSADLN